MHDDSTRALVTAALLAGESLGSVAKRYNLPRSTVASIRKALPAAVKGMEPAIQSSIDDLLVGALTMSLTAQKRIAEVASEPEYLRHQEAGDLAALYKELATHSVRLLEAASTVEDAEPAP